MNPEITNQGQDATQDAPAARQRGGRLWVKGEPSPNPGGRPRRSVELVEAAREHTAEALAVLVETMRKAKRLSTRLRAAEIIIDRGWGRAPMSISVDLAARVNLTAVSAAEWEALSMLRHTVRPALPASEAVVEVEGEARALPHVGSGLGQEDARGQRCE